jgi:hypothetical protein
MGLFALLSAALYYHPWATITLTGVTITLSGVILKLRRSMPLRHERT